ncbi:S-adenosyl-L-methionine-dependent methyltransferase [Histomonas meleagridis]|uniref:S-adenosyl-L-methionine-dependent methyltransferase n=1 Tax=Histomonas meleagridis TaxID=135588 RepID=UPI0035596EAF|nr:S-adenosyl-L-methionine-dependent methyltransferase [Histomonas meleagridis]KAH0805024.1 S-adenosyl-L-methionine-dependent methyltransferase [Histomonas meleagridis]
MKHLPPEELEEQHVHQVYDAIAKHFDNTRYKPWPGVKNFVTNIKPYSLLLDLGCGNGRNLQINPSVIDLGSDLSMPLCKLASKHGRPIFRASALEIPLRDNTFDHVICIAVIHHFSTPERRLQCLREISRVLKVGGTAFVTAWAIEQKNKHYETPDQMIPWTIDKRFGDENTRLQRFYHFFVKGEFAELIKDIDSLELVEETWEKENWNALLKKVK